MKISIVTVCYNEYEERIRLTAESVIAQSYPDVEWIVVDGGSDSETLAVLNRYRQYMHYFISEPDEGIYDAMNKGVKAATGDLVFFLNIGDRYPKADILMGVADYVLMFPSYSCYIGEVEMMSEDYSTIKLAHPPRSFKKHLFYRGTICHQAIFARKELFEEIGYFNTGYAIAADRDWLLRAVLSGASAKSMPFVVCSFHAGICIANRQKSRKEQRTIERQYFTLAERQKLLFKMVVGKWLYKLGLTKPASQIKNWVLRITINRK